jgi:hypothetical protein
MGNLAGDILQIVSPRTADDDGVIQKESTAKTLSSRSTVPSKWLRAQRAILYYKAGVKSAFPCHRSLTLGRYSFLSLPHCRSQAFAFCHLVKRECLRHHGSQVTVTRSMFFFDISIEHAGECHKHRRGTCRALSRTIADRVTVLAEICRCQWDVFHLRVSHWLTLSSNVGESRERSELPPSPPNKEMHPVHAELFQSKINTRHNLMPGSFGTGAKHTLKVAFPSRKSHLLTASKCCVYSETALA